MTFLSAMEKLEVWNSTGASAPMYTFLKRATQVNDGGQGDFWNSARSTVLLTSPDRLPFLSTAEHTVRHF